MAGAGEDASRVGKIARPTHADVARLARVSTATVSYVLNKAEGRRISARTREAVNRAAKQLGYRPNVAARNLASGKSGVVLYVVPQMAVGEMPMQAGSRMTTELAPPGSAPGADLRGRGRSSRRRRGRQPRSGGGHQPVPAERGALGAVKAAHVPHIEIGTLPALGHPHLSVGAIRVKHLVSRGYRSSPSLMPESPNGVPWATIG